MEEETPLLLPCSICGRTFKPESLEKHYKACERNTIKKRKVFDSTIQRIQGTDLAEFLPKILTNKNTESTSPREKPEKPIEYNKPEKKKTPDVKPKSGTNSVAPKPRDCNEQCPYCERSFCLKAFERHVEWCKDRRAPVTPSRNTMKAKEMLDARLKYHAPKNSKFKKKQFGEKPGTQTDIHEENSRTCHSVNEFSAEKFNDLVRCNSQLSRSKGNLNALSCNLSKRCASEAKLTELTPKQTSNFESPRSYNDRSRPMRTVNNDMVHQLPGAYNNNPCDSSTTEKLILPSKVSEISMENQEYYSAENISPESGIRDNGATITQSCYSANVSHHSDSSLALSPSTYEENASLSMWSSTQSKANNVGGMKRAKFCHECGSKYPIELAKFCCECGEQRLIINALSRSKI